ncbi:phospholipase D family protein [Marinobacterium weihaiense]|uniref:Phospholipase D family protein n=1 Tax=Marinobacterium weihaiense TaxID=2851016 RepID=A0ABS6MBL0_9GAMM|nr:phospholipase D family protein [Marinobacterium weihaiense]MBV0933684.1 phospholipase D family protein [Marinobacterium weihaiense]
MSFSIRPLFLKRQWVLNGLLLFSLVMSGCARLPDNSIRQASYHYADTEGTLLAQVSGTTPKVDASQSGFLLLESGLDAFVARTALARAAQRSIDAQYYLLHDDMTGQLFLDEMIQASRRGVRVRLLVDDMDLEGRDADAAALDAMPNVEVRIFNPFGRNVSRWSQFLTRFGSVTRRMHNKSFIVDGEAVVLGGRNIGNEYFEADPALAFGDLDVLGFGPIARQAAVSFDAYWNHALAYPATRLLGKTPDAAAVIDYQRQLKARIAAQAADYDPYFQALREARLTRRLEAGLLPLVWGHAWLVADDPDKLVVDRRRQELHLSRALAPYFLGLEESLVIFSPYFVPGREGTDLLKSLVQRGVRVQILTNSLASTDVPVVHAGYARYRRELLRAGVELYEMDRQSAPRPRLKTFFTGSSKASLHAKSFVLDGQYVFIGSLNLDPRSLVENSEVGVVIDSADIAGVMLEWFEQDVQKVAFRVTLEETAHGTEQLRWTSHQDGTVVRFDVEPHTCMLQRVGVGLMRLLPIESQL